MTILLIWLAKLNKFKLIEIDYRLAGIVSIEGHMRFHEKGRSYMRLVSHNKYKVSIFLKLVKIKIIYSNNYLFTCLTCVAGSNCDVRLRRITSIHISVVGGAFLDFWMSFMKNNSSTNTYTYTNIATHGIWILCEDFPRKDLVRLLL